MDANLESTSKAPEGIATSTVMRNDASSVETNKKRIEIWFSLLLIHAFLPLWLLLITFILFHDNLLRLSLPVLSSSKLISNITDFRFVLGTS